jgi:glutaredoxin 3
VQSHPDVLVYAKPFCPYCMAAKSLLQEKGVAFREIDITEHESERERMVQRTGRRTVPQIFIGGRHVGGYDDLAALDEQGELDALLGIPG